MSYKYDVFLSYTRAFPFGDWVREHFYPLFESYLSNALNRRRVSIFVDQQRISTGDAWPESLKNALAHSRCLVGIWSPTYFNSEWCVNECTVMFYRERQLGYRTVNNPHGLVLPVNVFDGEHFPPFAREIQCFDCRRFARSGLGFTKTERYIEFQDALITWVDEVASAINNVPPWSPDWLTSQWLDEVIAKIPKPAEQLFNAPLLD